MLRSGKKHQSDIRPLTRVARHQSEDKQREGQDLPNQSSRAVRAPPKAARWVNPKRKRGKLNPRLRFLVLRICRRFFGYWSWQKWRDSSQRPDHWNLSSRGRSLAMVMVADSLPGLKRWAGTGAQGQRQASGDPCGRRVPVACRKNVLLAGGWGCALRGSAPGSDQPLPGAATLAEARYQLDVAAASAGARGGDGLFVFIFDATLVSQAARKRKTPTAPATASVGRAKGAAMARTSMLARTATASRWAC